MGTRVPRSIGEYEAFEVDLGVCCSACGRVVVFQGGNVEAYLKLRGIRTSLPVETSVFRCRCGSREIETIGVPVSHRPAPHLLMGQMLVPLYVMRSGRKR